MMEYEHRYLYNQRLSKRLSLQMEKLSDDLKHFKDSFNFEQISITSNTLESIKGRLDGIWAEQVELYVKIKSHERTKATTI